MDANYRVWGYRNALLANGLEFRKDMVEFGLSNYDHGFTAAKVLLERHTQMTAIFCYNDLIAMGAVQSCLEIGLRIPEDCAITGFDNISFAALVHPPLTTIHVDKYEIGQRATSLLLDMLADPEKSFPSISLGMELIIRSSA